jgi:hypothetical protein
LDGSILQRPKFVNSSEETFAQILDYYGIPWEYEPHTFPLERDPEGHVLVAFTPDFYLPDEELYIELTTLRPKLMRQKNAKIRRLQELYPHIRIKLFRRQDLRDLMIKYGINEAALELQGTEAHSYRPDGNEADEEGDGD